MKGKLVKLAKQENRHFESGLTCGDGPRAVIVPSGEQVANPGKAGQGRPIGRTLDVSHGAGCYVDDFELVGTEFDTVKLLGVDADRDGTLDVFAIHYNNLGKHKLRGEEKYSIFVPGPMRQAVGDMLSKYFRESESVQLTFTQPNWAYILQGKYDYSLKMVEGAKKMLVEALRSGQVKDERNIDINAAGRGYSVDVAEVNIKGAKIVFIDKDLPQDAAQKLHEAAKVEAEARDKREREAAAKAATDKGGNVKK